MSSHQRQRSLLTGERQRAEDSPHIAVRLGHWVKLLSRQKGLLLGLVLFMSFVVMALFAPWIAPSDPDRMSIMRILEPPSVEAYFGTDDFGRDVFSRVVYGARISLRVGVLVSCFSALAGTFLGLISAYYPRLDDWIMRGLDAVMAFPVILVAIAIMAVLGPGELNAIIAITFVYTPQTARLVRSRVLTLRDEVFVESARALGASGGRILAFHILPNCLSVLMVQQTLVFAYAILVEAALSFMGVGTPPPAPSWGNILNESRDILRSAPWVSLAAGSTIALCVLSINLIGDALRDLFDPQSQARLML